MWVIYERAAFGVGGSVRDVSAVSLSPEDGKGVAWE